MVQAKLLVSPANEEGIGVEKKNDSKNSDHEYTQTQDRFHGSAALHFPEGGGEAEGVDDVVHGYHADAGADVGEIQLAVFPDAGDGQPGIECGHPSSPPVCSRVRVSEIRWYSCSWELSPR